MVYLGPGGAFAGSAATCIGKDLAAGEQLNGKVVENAVISGSIDATTAGLYS